MRHSQFHGELNDEYFLQIVGGDRPRKKEWAAASRKKSGASLLRSS
jgi:hypothetical protein